MVRRRTKQEQIEKFGTDDVRLYATHEAVKGLDYAGELFKKYKWLKYVRYIFLILLIMLIIGIFKFVAWLI
jgi:hypothetical protein